MEALRKLSIIRSDTKKESTREQENSKACARGKEGSLIGQQLPPMPQKSMQVLAQDELIDMVGHLQDLFPPSQNRDTTPLIADEPTWMLPAMPKPARTGRRLRNKAYPRLETM